MCTVFGNDLAVQYARTNWQRDYPGGSVLSLVTWKQEEDRRWFGGKIPAEGRSVEFVAVGRAADHRASYSYQEYEGAPLKKVSDRQGPTPDGRAGFLLSERAAVRPYRPLLAGYGE